MKFITLLAVLTMQANAQNANTVTGTATYRERIALPASAIFEATLQDVSRADAPATIIGTARLEKPEQPPFQFSISYDPAKIVERNSYVIRAKITVNGSLMFTTDQSYPVLTRSAGATVDMVLRRVALPTEANVSLRETYWKLIEIDGNAIVLAEQQREPNLVIRTQQDRVTGYGACNNFTGTYKIDGANISFTGVASTLMACVRGMDTEVAFHQALKNARSWKISGESLELYNWDSKVVARFQAVALR